MAGLKIIRHYGTLDTEFKGEYNTELLVDDKRVLYGDDYHDHIEDKIEGYIKGFSYGSNKEVFVTEENRPDNPDWD